MKPTYEDYGRDLLQYLVKAYNLGLRYNDMVSQAQRVIEYYLKQLICNSLMNANNIMISHNLREIYQYVERLGIDIKDARSSIMLLANYYTHTRYPGRDAFMADEVDIESAYKAMLQAWEILSRRCSNDSSTQLFNGV